MGLGALVIEVVLPTYNGAAYLAEQVASIHQQTLRPQRLLVRDDGSTDGTLELIQRLGQRYGDWLKVLSADGNLGCIGNINRLLAATTAPYVALADQDDVWLSHKLERSLELLQSLEATCGVELPLLVHGDLELMDEAGASLHTTYFQRQHLHADRVAPADLAMSNVVTGCTVLCNRALLSQALPIPKQALMHDWWLALVASAFGRVELLEDVLVRYRQHSRNVLGAQGLGLEYWRSRLIHFLHDPSAGGHTRGAIQQARCFEQRYHKVISSLPALMCLPRRRRWLALLSLTARERVTKHGPLRTFGLLVLLLLLPVQDE